MPSSVFKQPYNKRLIKAQIYENRPPQQQMQVNLNDFKFMQGFHLAKSILLQLKIVKQTTQAAAPLVTKQPSSNSLAFSPIAKQQSQAWEEWDENQHPKQIKMTDEGDFKKRTHNDKKYPQDQKDGHKSKSEVDQLKQKIDGLVLMLHETHSSVVVSERIVGILEERLQEQRNKFRRIQKAKNQQREKNLRILELKASIQRKTSTLNQHKAERQRYRQTVQSMVKQYIREYLEEEEIPISLCFVPDSSMVQVASPSEIRADEGVLQYPEELKFNPYALLKKTSQIGKKDGGQQMGGGMGVFANPKKNKSFGNSEMENYVDDNI